MLEINRPHLVATPLAVNNMTVKNRFLRSATMENMADCEGFVTEELIKLYYELAIGQSGLIISGAAAVEPRGRCWPRQLAVWDDKFIAGLRKVVQVIHRYGQDSKCALQLHHGGMGGYGYSYGETASEWNLNEATDGEISASIQAFSEAARRAQMAGFDAVAVHAGHGYLISQFLSPAINKRTDRWGGTLQKRMRFALEVCRKIRESVGNGMPLLWKMNCADFQAEGQEIEAYAEIADTLMTEGVDLIELSGGLKDQLRLRSELKLRAGLQEAYFREAIVPFKKVVGKKALAITGGIRSLEVMEELLAQGVEFIGLSRPLVCEPDLPRRLLDTPDQRRSKCTSCNRCLTRIAKQSLKCVEFDDLQTIINSL